MYCIYLAKNTANGKVYVGKTNNLPKRKREHFLDRRREHLFSRALHKYGENAFKWSVLEDRIETLECANERERYWIAQYNSYFKDPGSQGYNMTRGGDGGNMWNVKRVAVYTLDGKLERAFESVTECAKYLDASGTTSVSAVCDKPGRTCQGRMIVSYSDVPKPEIKPYEWENPKCIPICRIDPVTREIFRYASMTHAEKDGFRRTGILGCIKGRYKQSKGYIWCYENELESAKDKTVESLRAYGVGKHILQMDSEGNILAKYNNCAEAARAVNAASNKTIHGALTSKTHFSHGYYWYKE